MTDTLLIVADSDERIDHTTIEKSYQLLAPADYRIAENKGAMLRRVVVEQTNDLVIANCLDGCTDNFGVPTGAIDQNTPIVSLSFRFSHIGCSC